MSTRLLSNDELARRGEEVYRTQVAPSLGPDDAGKFVLIDVETAAFEVGADELAVAERLRSRRPQAQVWFRRVGERPVRRYGRRAVR